MGEKIREHLKKFREAAGLTQKQLGAMAGKGESAIQAYESGKSDIPLSALISIMGALKISFADLERGSKTEPPAEKPVEILIYNQEDRLNTAAILVKNGYGKQFNQKPNIVPAKNRQFRRAESRGR